MGANQSSGSGDGDSSSQNHTARRCYYDILGIDSKASEDEIKKAYRRKALELHPDRNYGNVDAATAQFAEVQTAYEILSDPQERAWYDSHRDQILRGDPGDDAVQRPTNVTTTEDILSLLTKFNSKIQFDDSANGFYGAIRDLFAKLGVEEDDAAAEADEAMTRQYPGFGYADDNYEDSVRNFYAAWTSFATRKTFSWKDVYRYSEAPDRKIRRLMEKENKRLRDEAAREFNDAVRSLVSFIKKRDPRFQPNKQSEAERQKILKDAAAAQAARSRAANKQLEEETLPEWMKASAPKDDIEFQEADWDSENEDPKVEFECVLCNKTFKSEKQFEAHEKSKKHVKAAEQIKRQMRRENRDLDLDEDAGGVVEEEPDADLDDGKEAAGDEAQKDRTRPLGDGDTSEDDEEDHLTAENSSKATPLPATPGPGSPDDSSASDADYASREAVAARIHGGGSPVDDVASQLADQSLDDTESASAGPEKSKIGKAKLKKAKKAAAASGGGSTAALKCNICSADFPSKNRLFSHLKEEHQAGGSQAKGGKGEKGKRK